MSTSYLLLPPQMPTAPPQSYSHSADSLASYFTDKTESIVTELSQVHGETANVVVQVKNNIGENSSGDSRDEESGLILNYFKSRIKRLDDGWDKSKEEEKKL